MPIVRAPTSLLLTGVFLAAGVLLGTLVGVKQINGAASALDRVENLTLDWRFLLAGPRPAPEGVVIVAIDDRTLSETGGNSLPRESVARIVRALADAHPRAVALDIAFLDPKAPEADAALAEALKSVNGVVGAIGLFGGGRHSGGEPRLSELALAPQPSDVLWPTDAVRDAAQVGLANVSTDASGVPRYIPMIYQIPDGVIPSFALAAASAALGAEPVIGPDRIELAGRTTKMDLGYHMPVRYYGPAGSFRRISAADVLRGRLDPESVRDHIVVVGITATGLGDTFATPFDRVAPGAEVFATAIGNLVSGQSLARTPSTRRIDAAAAVALPVVMIAFMAMRRPAVGFAIAGFVFVLWAAGVFLTFVNGYWLSVAAPLASAAPLCIGYAAARYIVERRAAGRIAAERSMLAKFQSPLLLDHILQEPRFLHEPVRQDLAVVFLDLSGFTGAAEALGPEWSRDLLGGMQTLVEREVTSERGIVINFMGDGVLAAFGLPKPQGDDAARALIAVERLHTSAASWLADLPPAAKERLDFRIGAHFGPAVISRQGSPSHQQISAAGDTVNVASRLLEVAKQQRCRVVVTEDLFQAASAAAPLATVDTELFTPLTVSVRGRTSPLQVRIRR
jgi:adenylate cyclase